LTNSLWQKALLPPGNEDSVWELFHENSKNGRHSNVLSKEEVQARIKELYESLPYEGYPVVTLPQYYASLTMPLGEAITSRASARDMEASPLTLSNVATILHYAYGVTRKDTDMSPRALRTVPSGGALYPLEIFFHSANVEGLRPGLYHFNPAKRNIRFLREGNATKTICESLLQPNLALGASLVIFITAIFERSIFKYQDRGYRYTLLETGHVAQNINLVSAALSLGCVNLGGFLDREIDDYLDLDGVTHSTVYMVVIGGKRDQLLRA
jgi:SagB-type dehydrogenase family enzyme